MVRHSPERRRHRVCAGEAVLLPEREEALLAAVEGGVLLRSLLDFEFLVSLQALVAGALVVFCAAPWRRPPRTIATRHFGLRQRIQRGLLLGRGVLRAFLAALLCLRGLRPRAFARVCAARASGQGGPRRTRGLVRNTRSMPCSTVPRAPPPTQRRPPPPQNHRGTRHLSFGPGRTFAPEALYDLAALTRVTHPNSVPSLASLNRLNLL